MGTKGTYRSLDPARIVQTLERLQRRIEERFPASGLSAVAADLLDVGHATGERARRLRRPYFWLRSGVALTVLLGLAAQVLSIRYVRIELQETDVSALIQGLDAAVNLLIIMAGAVWFLATWESRLKRDRTLAALHELRALAHVIDMHQLTKDPTVVLAPGARTESSPQRTMSRFELTRYLEYCSEMLALIGKLAALYAESAPDPDVVDAVNDIEKLASDLGRKIWQKITILQDLDEAGVA